MPTWVVASETDVFKSACVCEEAKVGTAVKISNSKAYSLDKSTF